jgi:hypothetical protein
MAMTEEEILREAARIQAARRRRVERRCEHCGTSYEGLTHSRYCSDRCRVAASRERRTTPVSTKTWDEKDLPAPQGKDESLDDYFARMRERTKQYWAPNPVPPEVERQTEAFERLLRTSERIMAGRVFEEDSTEILRQSREERTAELMRALGWESDESAVDE